MKIRMGRKPIEGRELIQLADSNHMHKTKWEYDNHLYAFVSS
jgi:hypothetical protein